jgi:hypothetical protein
MTNTYVGAVQLVRVLIPNGARPRTAAFWLAAVAADQAVAAVQKKIPSNWVAEPTGNHLSQVEIERLKLRPGEVREYTSSPSSAGTPYAVSHAARR